MNRRLATLAAAAALTLAAAGCSDAERARNGALGRAHRVELYSGGKVVRTWVSTGVVHSEEKSDGWYFMDAETRVLVRVSGPVVVTPITVFERPRSAHSAEAR